MCIGNPLKTVASALPLSGVGIASSLFKGKKKRPEEGERTTVTQGTVGPGPTVGAY